MEPDRRVAALLDRRTAALAARMPRGAAGAGRPPSPLAPLIVWAIGDSLYATEVGAIAAVMPFAGCARVPTREPACLGVIGRAGRFYSVIDMRRLLGGTPWNVPPDATATGPRGHLLLLRGAAPSLAPSLALAVERVLGRFDLPPDSPVTELDGRLVARFDPAGLAARLGHSSGQRPRPDPLPSHPLPLE